MPPRYTQSKRINLRQARLCILAFSLVFTAYSRTQWFHLQACVVLKPLVPLIGHLVACRAVDTNTDRPSTVVTFAPMHARVNQYDIAHQVVEPYQCTNYCNLYKNSENGMTIILFSDFKAILRAEKDL